jgi:hypothetical protein
MTTGVIDAGRRSAMTRDELRDFLDLNEVECALMRARPQFEQRLRALWRVRIEEQRRALLARMRAPMRNLASSSRGKEKS